MVRLAALVATLAVLVAFATAAKKDDAPNPKKLELVKLVALNRHGHRAPNAPYWKMCPNDIDNRKRYDVLAEDLTGIGFTEEYEFGQYIRKHYGSFIGEKYNRKLHYARAVAEPRTLQSAQAIMQGMFPDGFGPRGFLPSKPQVVPVFADMNEDLLKDCPCFPRAKGENAEWFEKRGMEIMNETKNHAIMTKLRKICGTPEGIIDKYGYDWYLKLVVDGVVFNYDYGLKIVDGKIDEKMVWQLRNLSIVILLGKFYHSDAQQTYATVDFPIKLLTDMHRAAAGNRSFTLIDTYCVHREEIYGYAAFYGFQFHVPGFPHGEIPAGSTLLFELLHDKDAKKHYLKLILWTPHAGKYTVAVPGCKIHRLCTLDELQSLYDKRVKRTGTWQQLCDVEQK